MRTSAPDRPPVTRPQTALNGLLVGFFFQAEDGIRDLYVTGVQTCALPIWTRPLQIPFHAFGTELAAIERELLPRLEAHHGVVAHLELDAALLAAEAAVRLHQRRSEERRVGKECRARGSMYH